MARTRVTERHGMTNSLTYKSWFAMRARCKYKSTVGWDRYGGAGITVCERWQNSFLAFLEDMGHRPSKVHSIERRKNSLGYFKENCYWGTRSQQSRNRDHQKRYDVDGKMLLPCEIDELKGYGRGVTKQRLRIGWSLERILSTPAGRDRVRHDLTGRTFGRWTVISLHSHGGTTAWNCRCACGTEKPVFANGLISGRSKSCGCARSSP